MFNSKDIFITMVAVISLALVLCIHIASASTVDFSWLPNDDEGLTAGYMLHYGEQSKVYPFNKDILLPAPVDNRVQGSIDIPDGTWFVGVTAYNSDGEHSIPSEVKITLIPAIEYSIQLSLLPDSLSAFTTPDTNVVSVQFSIDGTVINTEEFAPFELSGGEENVFDTSALIAGEHTIMAEITLENGEVKTINDVFTIENKVIIIPIPDSVRELRIEFIN